MAIAVVGEGSVEGASGTSCTTSAITTTGAGKVLIAVAVNGTTVTSVTGASLTFSQRAIANNFPNNIELWEADSAGAISSQTFTANLDSSTAFVSAIVFGVEEEDGFDANGSLPDQQAGATDPTVSTTASDTMIIGAFRFQSTATPTAPADWTAITAGSGGYMGVWYRIYSSAQTSLTIADGGNGSGDSNAAIGDALVQAAAAVATPGIEVFRTIPGVTH